MNLLNIIFTSIAGLLLAIMGMNAQRASSGGGGDTGPWIGQYYYVIGNSVAAGVGATDQAHSWPYALKDLRGAEGVVVNATPGSVITPAAGSGVTNNCVTRRVYVPSDVPTKNDITKYIFFCHGVNDLGVNVPAVTPDAFEAAYSAMIESALAKGWPAGSIVLVTPTWITGYSQYVCGDVTTAPDQTRHEAFVAKVVALANTYHTCLIDVYTAMKNDPANGTFLADGIHPNDVGHAFIANYMNSFNYIPQ